MKNYDGDGGANRDIDELERERNGGLTDRELEQQKARKVKLAKRKRRTMTETSTDLIDTSKITAIDIYVEDGGVDTVLNKIREVVDKFEPDITSRQGRMEIASFAARVARSKTFLDGQGKDMVAAQKAETKLVDEKRKHIRDTLDALKKDVRKPLTEWEAEEELRVADHKKRLVEISDVGAYALLNWDTMSLDAMREKWAELKAVDESEDHWEEFVDEAAVTLARAFSDVTSAITKRDKADVEKAEAQRLREEAAERAEADRKAAEEKRQAERDTQAKKLAEDAAVQGIKDADDRAKVAEKEAEDAKETAEREAAEKVRADKAAEEQAETRRKADEQHREKIEGEAIAALTVIMDSDTAFVIVKSIAQGNIPNVKITY